MLFRFLVLVLCCSLFSCKDFVQKYKHSSSGLSSLDRKVLYDFRQPIPVAAPSVDSATQKSVFAAVPPASCPTTPGRRAPGPQRIVAMVRGSFTYAAEDEIAYLVSPSACPAYNLVIFGGGKLQLVASTPYSSIAGTYDLNRDDKNELLLLAETERNGEISREASLQTIEKNTLRAVDDLGIVYHDSCAVFSGTDEQKKQKLINSGYTPYIEAVVVYYLPHSGPEYPSFTAERYRAACPAPGATPRNWQLVTK